MKVETAPGYVWEVAYEWEDGETDAMIVSGLTIEAAVQEARWSLELAEAGFAILSAKRLTPRSGE